MPIDYRKDPFGIVDIAEKSKAEVEKSVHLISPHPQKSRLTSIAMPCCSQRYSAEVMSIGYIEATFGIVVIAGKSKAEVKKSVHFISPHPQKS